jgi:hypothetical protein
MQRSYDFGRDLFKVLIMVLMVLNHSGGVIFEGQQELIQIGKFGLPILFYLTALGAESTRNTNKYIMRLLLFALIGQIPFFMLRISIGARGELFGSLNTMFSLAFGTMFISVFQNPILFLVLPASFFLTFWGGWYAILSIASMRVLRKNTKLGVGAYLILNGYVLIGRTRARWVWGPDILLLLLALSLILLHNSGYLHIKREVKRNYKYPLWKKYIFYIFYPVHLIILYAIRLWLVGQY